jgi:hypothetical protein
MKNRKITQQQSKILKAISGKARTIPSVSVYYKPKNDKDLSVFMVSESYNDKIEDKVYSLQSKIISKYEDNDIDFRLTPKYNIAEKSLVPSGFKKLAFA